jgi:CubicO group peptidase (beta-lactamase class C family)
VFGSVVIATIALASGVPPAAGAPAADAAGAALAGVVDGIATAQRQRLSVAGAVVVVVKDGAIALAKGYGLADAAARRSMTADETLVHVGSISKLFTGIAVMQLVERGVLDLDRDVNAYLDFHVPTPPGGVPVTLGLLLTHRAGFEEHAKDLFARGPVPVPLGRWLRGAQPRRLFPGGDVPAYSNYGMALAGYVVERASGIPFATYVRERILRPLGMAHSTFEQPLPPALAPLMARGYPSREAAPLPFVETIPAAPAGALAASGADMGRFMLALLGGGTLDGARVLAPATLARMMAPAVVTPTGGMGLAFFESRIDEQPLIGHDGGTMTFSSRLLLSPAQRLGIFICYDGGEVGREWNELPRAILRHYAPVAAGPPGPEAGEGAAPEDGAAPGTTEDVPVAARAAGAYQTTRRADSTFVRFEALLSQIIIRDNGDGTLTSAAALPFGRVSRFRRDQRGAATFRDAKGRALAFSWAPDGAARLDIGAPAQTWQRVPAYLNARVVLPVVSASALFALVAVAAWPVGRAVRRLRRPRAAPPGEPPAVGRARLVTRVALALQVATVAAALALHVASRRDMTLLSAAFDPFVVGLYALAWLGVAGSVPCAAVAGWFWQARAGSRAARLHHTAAALAALVLAWFFITWHLAGTTLVY